MTLEKPLFQQPLAGNFTYTAAQLRSLVDVFTPVDGVTSKNDLKVSQRGAGANMSVDVAAGQLAVTGSSIVNQGTYLARNTATVNVAVAAAPGSGSRIDLIVAQVYDDQADGSSLSSWTPIAVTGSVGGGVPATPANALPLAQVSVSAGQSSIVTANITDVRTLNTLGDVPLWEVSGGNGQSIATGGSGVPYTGWNVSDNIGMTSVVTGSGVTIRQAGRYIASFSVRYDNGGTASTIRAVYINQIRGATLIRRAQQTMITVGSDALSVTTTMRALPGDVIQAFIYQNSGVALHIDDANKEAAFSGCWVGP